MALFVQVYDSTAKKKRYVAYPGFHDYVETVTGSPKTVFNLDIDIDADHAVDVDIDGRNQPLENTHWTRDIVNNRITMSENVNVTSIFKARIYLK